MQCTVCSVQCAVSVFALRALTHVLNTKSNAQLKIHFKQLLI